MGSMVLLDLMGGVALLLWGLHMVHSGILRAFGPDLRVGLAKGLGNRFTAFGAGLGLTALLQSSTATALITSSFTSEGLVSLVPERARRTRVGERDHRRSRALHHRRRCRDLGGAFLRRQRIAGDVAGLCPFHLAARRAGARARRQSRQRRQPDFRRRPARQPGKL